MPERQPHQQEVQAFLQSQLARGPWRLSLPEGSGNETYFARSGGRACFVKLGTQVERYQAVASVGLTPQILAVGSLEDGTSILVQAYITGRKPSRSDYQSRLKLFALAIATVHHSPELKQVLPRAASDQVRDAGLEALLRLRQKWERWKAQVPAAADFVDESLARLQQQVLGFEGAGLAASHNDLCNANWLISDEGALYLIDLDSMALDDPALDIGATLWWYYPPGLREEFLRTAGYSSGPAFGQRMLVRMAVHCLSIILPREHSYDTFDPASFEEALTDFRAVLAGKENPQGYAD